MGIEPTSQPWEGRILPMKYTRILILIITKSQSKIKYFYEVFIIYLPYNLNIIRRKNSKGITDNERNITDKS